MKFLKQVTIFTLLCTLCFVGCAKKEESDAIRFKNEYESLNNTTRQKDGKTIRSISIDEDNPIQYATCKEIFDKIENKDSFFVYFGFADCPWCRSVLEMMLKAAKDSNIETIYYVDISNVRDELTIDEDGSVITSKKGDASYMALLKALESVLDDYELDGLDPIEKRIYAPNTIYIENGKPIQCIEGTSELEQDPYMELSDDMLNDSYQQFMDLFHIDSACELETKC